MASIEVDGESVEVNEGSSLKEALEALGFEITLFPSQEGFFVPCQMGGCWACALDIDGHLLPGCISTVQQGMRIKTDTSSLTPKRPVGGFMGIMWVESEPPGGSVEITSRWPASQQAATSAALSARTGGLPTWATKIRSPPRRQRS
jgi:hypothetical protein